MDRNTLTGYPFVDYVAKDDIPAFLAHVRQCISQRAEVTSEVDLVTHGGASHTVQLRSIPVEDSQHEIVLSKTAIADITANRQIEEALRESEERLRMAVEATGLGTWDYDLLSERLTWSRENKAIFGLSADAEIDYPKFLSHLHPEDRPRVDIAAQAAVSANGTGEYHCQYRVIRPDGEVRAGWRRPGGRSFGKFRGSARQSALSEPRWTSPIASRPRKPPAAWHLSSKPRTMPLSPRPWTESSSVGITGRKNSTVIPPRKPSASPSRCWCRPIIPMS